MHCCLPLQLYFILLYFIYYYCIALCFHCIAIVLHFAFIASLFYFIAFHCTASHRCICCIISKLYNMSTSYGGSLRRSSIKQLTVSLTATKKEDLRRQTSPYGGQPPKFDSMWCCYLIIFDCGHSTEKFACL